MDLGESKATKNLIIIVYLGSVTRKVKKLTDDRRSEIANRWVLVHEKVARIWNMLKYQNLSETKGMSHQVEP